MGKKFGKLLKQISEAEKKYQQVLDDLQSVRLKVVGRGDVMYDSTLTDINVTAASCLRRIELLKASLPTIENNPAYRPDFKWQKRVDSGFDRFAKKAFKSDESISRDFDVEAGMQECLSIIQELDRIKNERLADLLQGSKLLGGQERKRSKTFLENLRSQERQQVVDDMERQHELATTAKPPELEQVNPPNKSMSYIRRPKSGLPGS